MEPFKINDNTELILGPPGTGKTTTLLNRVSDLLARGVHPSKIAYVSFTRMAAEEARNRAIEKFPNFVDADMTGFKTLHAMAYRYLGCNNNLMFNRKHAYQFGKSIGQYIGGISVQDDSDSMVKMSKGTQMMFSNNYSRCCLIDQRDGWRKTIDMGIEVAWIEQDYFNTQYDTYRKENDIYDFTDMLECFAPNAHKMSYEWIIVDEAQDLMALQWQVVQGLSKNAKGVIVAGDDDQAIYQWSGAAVDIFLDLEFSKKTVLDKSYRLPKKVFDVANSISARISDRYEKEWTPRNENGMVSTVYNFEEVNLAEGQWLILVRNNALIAGICNYLKTQGFNYWSKQDAPFDEHLVRDIRSWETLRAGGHITLNAAIRVYSRMRVGQGYKRGFKELPQLPRNEHVTLKSLQETGGLKTTEPWYDAFTAEEPDQVEYMRKILRSGEKLSRPRIIVSTIHSIKGGEADNVLLYLDMSRRTAQMAETRVDEEARVFYVGVTRARHKLFLMHGPFENKYRISLKNG